MHAVQGCTVEGRPVIHQPQHPYADTVDVHSDWLDTAVSGATGSSSVRVVDDVHRSVSDITGQERGSWVSRKVSNFRMHLLCRSLLDQDRVLFGMYSVSSLLALVSAVQTAVFSLSVHKISIV